MRKLLVVILAATALLAACGSDSDDESGSRDVSTPTTSTGTTSQTTSDAERAEKRAQAKRKREREAEQESSKDSSKGSSADSDSDSTQQQSSPSDSADKRTIDPKSGLFKFPPKQRAVYAGAVAACQIQGPDGIAARYKINSEDPAVIARGYAQEVAPRSGREAAFEGCQAGFREFKRNSSG